MGDSFQTGNGDISKKQSGYLSSTNGGLSKGQSETLGTDNRNSALSEKLQRQAPKSGNNSVIKSVVK